MKEKKNNIFIVLAVPVVIFLILTACIDNYGFHSLKIVLSTAIIPQLWDMQCALPTQLVCSISAAHLL